MDEEKAADRERLRAVLAEEELQDAVERRLREEARQELLDHYSRLSREAELRERRALWRQQRLELGHLRRAYLKEEEERVEHELEYLKEEEERVEHELEQCHRSGEIPGAQGESSHQPGTPTEGVLTASAAVSAGGIHEDELVSVLGNQTSPQIEDGTHQTDDGTLQKDDGNLQTDDGNFQTGDGTQQTGDGTQQTGDGTIQTDGGTTLQTDGTVPQVDDGRAVQTDGGSFPQSDSGITSTPTEAAEGAAPLQMADVSKRVPGVDCQAATPSVSVPCPYAPPYQPSAVPKGEGEAVATRKESVPKGWGMSTRGAPPPTTIQQVLYPDLHPLAPHEVFVSSRGREPPSVAQYLLYPEPNPEESDVGMEAWPAPPTTEAVWLDCRVEPYRLEYNHLGEWQPCTRSECL